MQLETGGIEELSADDRGDIVDMFVLAFHDYPVFTYVLKDASEEAYEHQLRLLIGFFVDARLMRGWPVFGIREDGELAAALLLSDPVFKPIPEDLDAVYDELGRTVGERALARLDNFDAVSAAHEPRSQTYFVGMVGTRPSSQGRGYGRKLMERVAEMSRARPESAGVTLTTEVPENLRFYERLGYRVLGSAEVGNITTWFHFRKN